MTLKTLVTGFIDVNCYILGCETSKQGIVIDPGGDPEKIIAALSNAGIHLTYIVLTHGHWDHIGAVDALKQKYNAAICLHEEDNWLYSRAQEFAEIFGFEIEDQPPVDRFIKEGDLILAGSITLKVLHTAGHSPGSVCLLANKQIFTGDLLFAGGIGRTDLPGGSDKMLKNSIRNKVFKLHNETVVYPGHGPATTVGDEKRSSLYIADEGF